MRMPGTFSRPISHLIFSLRWRKRFAIARSGTGCSANWLCSILTNGWNEFERGQREPESPSAGRTTTEDTNIPADRIKIRRAGPEDASIIAEVLQESFVEFKELYSDEGFAATTPSAEEVLSRMREGPVWVVLCDGAVSGTVSAKSTYIRGMAVLPSARGSGAGLALLQHAEGWAAKQVRARLFLSTTPFLSSAIVLYERSGFRRNEEGPHELFGTPLLTMEKDIHPK